MEHMQIIAGLVLMALLAWPLYNLWKAFYSLFDHCEWDPGALPDPNAKIISFSSEQVQYTKNGAKYKTTVKFSDGFYFITHKTKRENSFFSYRISIDEHLKREILECAIIAHTKAIQKKSP